MSRLAILCMSFNRHRGLRMAIDSVLAQTFKDWTLMICDDDSPDDRVRQVVAEYTMQDERIKSVINPRVRYTEDERQRVNTLGRRLNDGIDMLPEGVEFVTYLGDGITYYPKRCQRLINHLDAHPDAAAAWGHQVVDTYQHGQLVARTDRKEGGPHREFPGPVLAQNLAGQNMIDHCSIVERVGVAQQFRWTEDPQHWRTPDWERWRRIAAAGKRFDFLPRIGEAKRTGAQNLGVLMRGGKSIDEVVADRIRAAEDA